MTPQPIRNGCTRATRAFFTIAFAAFVTTGFIAVRQTAAEDAAARTDMLSATLSWGDPLATDGDDLILDNEVLGVTAAFKIGGAWFYEPTGAHGWLVDAADPDFAALEIGLDRTAVLGDAALTIGLLDAPDSALYVDLLTAQGVPVATNVAGNLLAGSGQAIARSVTLPLAAHPEATFVQLRCAFGSVAVFSTELAPAANGGMSSGAMTSPPGVSGATNSTAAGVGSTTLDGYTTNAAGMAGTGALGDGLATTGSGSNGARVATMRANIVYVDAIHGHDGKTGRAMMPATTCVSARTTSTGATSAVVTVRSVSLPGGDGPKATIRAGLLTATPVDTLVIRSGCYGETLNLVGRSGRVVLVGSVNLCGKSIRRTTASDRGHGGLDEAAAVISNRPPTQAIQETMP